MNQAAKVINVSLLNGSNGFSIEANNFFDAFVLGWYVSSAGDVNGDSVADAAQRDGYDDLIVADDERDGHSYVVFGKTGDFSASFDLSTLDGSNGFLISNSNTPNSLMKFAAF
ncbi:MAG: hypothetical protein U7123_06730 [Potamolinea sp.]